MMKVMNPVSAVVIAKNEAKKIRQVVENLSFCGEVIVVDNESTDQTAIIATKSGAKVVSQKGQNFAEVRNVGLKATNQPWVLFIDADETVSVELKNEIVQIINNPEIKTVGYQIKRTNYFLGHEMKYGEIGQDWVVRLAKKETGEWQRGVHEVWVVKGEVGRLKNPLVHQTAINLTDFLDKMIAFAKLHALANLAEGKKASFWKVLVYPKAKFVNAYILKAGWRDGVYGLVYAMTMAFHSFLAWGDAWVLQKKSAKD